MEFDNEVDLMFSRLGMEVDYDLLPHITALMARAYTAGEHDLELKIARWGDITPADKKFILNN